ncbi:MAG: hypothetical protein DMG11_00965 [Acidobacteria bacterium]|nr:MAG: hypothetical protein DMG11_00965 [Acidobacteriota bacterium]
MYESRIIVPQWLSFSTDSGYRWNAEAARRANVGLRFWVYVTTVPLTLLTLAIVAAWWTPNEVRNWWLAAGAAVLVDRVMTFAYFIPTMLTLMNNQTISGSEAVAKATQWINLVARYPVLTLIHILPALFFLVLGPLQFSQGFRDRHLQWHRRNGRVLLVSGTVVGVSALVMSFGMPSIGGVNQAAATTLFALFFLFALAKAFRHIRRREIRLHREWMIRAFSIGLAVATIRPIVGIFFATSPFTGLTPYEFFGTAFWIGFVLHLTAAEVWIQSTRPLLPSPKSSDRHQESVRHL